MDTINIVGTYLHCEVERLLPSKMEFTEEGKESDEYKFEEGSSGEDLDAYFGKLNLHNEQESSSDVCSVVDENASDSEDDSIFYECHEKSISRIYQTSQKLLYMTLLCSTSGEFSYLASLKHLFFVTQI